MLQRRLCTKEILQACRRAFGKFNQKIHIASGRIEVICPRRRAKHFQAAYVEALANGGDAGTALGDGGVHEGIQGAVSKLRPAPCADGLKAEHSQVGGDEQMLCININVVKTDRKLIFKTSNK